MNIKRILLILTSIIIVIISQNIFAQGGNPFAAPTEAMDTLNNAPTGAGGAGQVALDRARTTTAAQPVGRGGASSGRGGASFGRGGAVTTVQPVIPGAEGAALQPAADGSAQPQAPPEIPKVKVITGEKITCAVCGVLLQDVTEKEVPEEEQADYFDDGTHGDAEADDGIYTNVVERKDMIGSECADVLQKTVALINGADELDSMDFYRLHVTTNEPLSALPITRQQERTKDERLKEWNDKFLRKFRKDPNDPKSEFYSVYIPPPPEVPSILPPTVPRETTQQATQTRGGGGGQDIRGGYYDTSRLNVRGATTSGGR